MRYVANRDNVVPIATFLGAGAIAWAALKQAKKASLRHAKQTEADQERRITESFAKAGEQLGSDKLETRLVGIYTLERIAGESEREYWPIMETLTTFVREHAPWQPRQAVTNPFVEPQSNARDAGESTPAEQPNKEAEPTSVQVKLATDIQAVLTVLGRRDETARKLDQAAGRRLDLPKTDLRGAILRGAHLECADLRGAHLEGANLLEAHLEGANLLEAHLEGAALRRTHLEGAILWEAHLQRAILLGANLEDADLWGAHLEGAALWEAHLQRADLLGAHLEGATLWEAHLQRADLLGAHLEGADLRGAVGLTREQLWKAYGDARTVLPDGLTRPAHWPASPPDAPPDKPDNPE